MPYRLMQLPKRMKLLKLWLDPTARESRIERLEPKRIIPNTLTVEPRRM
jgi:hypothetical protein